MALGASPGLVARMFVLKALAVGVMGGIVGCLLGVIAAMIFGPQWAGVDVTPLPSLIAIACAVAVLVSLAAAWWPARNAAKLDPCFCFQEH
jgi:putative ABC transport system permease protein